jgi:hypothetical protein
VLTEDSAAAEVHIRAFFALPWLDAERNRGAQPARVVDCTTAPAA